MRLLKSKSVIIFLALVLIGSIIAFVVLKEQDSQQKQPAVETHESATQKNVKVTIATTDNDKTKPQNSQDVKIVQPSGVYASNHKPNLDGDPAPNSLNSTCRTNPGINCEIQFIKDGVIKVLGPNKTGADGFVSWDWKLQDIGLTVGSWQIVAVASSGNNSESSTDTVMLKVGP